MSKLKAGLGCTGSMLENQKKRSAKQPEEEEQCNNDCPKRSCVGRAGSMLENQKKRSAKQPEEEEQHNSDCPKRSCVGCAGQPWR